VEKLITMGKNGSLHQRRLLISKLKDAGVANKVMTTLADRYKDRQGGYVRILKAGFRYGDAAPMAIIELVDREIVQVSQTVETELGEIKEAPVKAKKAAKPAAAAKSKVKDSAKSSVKASAKKTTAQRKPSI
jgi:large subunit ribosomal protein L17